MMWFISEKIMNESSTKEPESIGPEPSETEPQYYSPSEWYVGGARGLLRDIVRRIVLSPWYLFKVAWFLVGSAFFLLWWFSGLIGLIHLPH
jgi:hypothetical protein